MWKQIFWRAASTNQIDTFPAKLIVGTDQIIKKIIVILQQIELVACDQTFVETIKPIVEIERISIEGINRIHIMQKRLECIVRFAQCCRSREQQRTIIEYLHISRENIVRCYRITIRYVETQQRNIIQLQALNKRRLRVAGYKVAARFIRSINNFIQMSFFDQQWFYKSRYFRTLIVTIIGTAVAQ